MFLQQPPMQARWLLIDGTPSLSGASAVAIVELLWSMADAIDREYTVEIAGFEQTKLCRACRHIARREVVVIAVDAGQALARERGGAGRVARVSRIARIDPIARVSRVAGFVGVTEP